MHMGVKLSVFHDSSLRVSVKLLVSSSFGSKFGYVLLKILMGKS